MHFILRYIIAEVKYKLQIVLPLRERVLKNWKRNTLFLILLTYTSKKHINNSLAYGNVYTRASNELPNYQASIREKIKLYASRRGIGI